MGLVSSLSGEGEVHTLLRGDVGGAQYSTAYEDRAAS